MPPVLDATHLPPLLTLPGESVELRYDIVCLAGDDPEGDRPCDPSGSVFVRAGATGTYRELPLTVDPQADEGRYVAVVPREIAGSSHGFTYYAEIRGEAAVASKLVLPAGGSDAPHHSLPIRPAIQVSLGAHVFGAGRRADARVLHAAWGDAGHEVGVEGGPNLSPIGPASFDVDRTRTVHLLDQVHRRLLRWPAGRPTPSAVPLPIDGTLADLSVAPDGTSYVLELARAGQPPLLRAIGADGQRKGAIEIDERTASQVRIGLRGPVVLQHPSGQWVPAVFGVQPLASPIHADATSGRAFQGGSEVVVLRRANEVRAAITDAGGVRRAWRVTSATPLGEVQLAEPFGAGLLLVLRVYTDTADEFVALVLDREGMSRRLSLDSADWSETAPLSRFRLVESSLYQLGSTAKGVFVDRFDLEAN